MIETKVEQTWRGNIIKIQGKRVVSDSSFEVGLVVEGQAKLLCPIDYGYLAASITTQSRDKGTELETPSPNASKEHSFPHEVSSFKKIEKPSDEAETLVGTAVDYGPYVEFGTKYMDSQPFLRPAFDLAMGKVLTIVKKNSKFYFADYLRRPKK